MQSNATDGIAGKSWPAKETVCWWILYHRRGLGEDFARFVCLPFFVSPRVQFEFDKLQVVFQDCGKGRFFFSLLLLQLMIVD